VTSKVGRAVVDIGAGGIGLTDRPDKDITESTEHTYIVVVVVVVLAHTS
jgi:hypothetical protein